MFLETIVGEAADGLETLVGYVHALEALRVRLGEPPSSVEHYELRFEDGFAELVTRPR